MTDRYLTTAQVAERLGIAKVTLETWRYAGRGPRYCKLGVGQRPAIRYSESDLAAWLATQTVEAKS